MINFILYEDEKKYRKIYISILLKVIGNSNLAYRIIEIEKYDKDTLSEIKKLTGKKIFILDVEVPGKSGLDLAREIRNSGDWLSQIIVVTTHEHLKNIALTGRILVLDFISKYYNMENDLLDSLKLSINILNNHKSLNYKDNGEIYQIPYDDILYIETNVDDSYSNIITKESRIESKKLIGTIEKTLKEDDRFFRAHRSYIVNINNITKVELNECIIHFGNRKYALLSRDKKNELKSILFKK